MLQDKNSHTIIRFVLYIIVITFACVQYVKAESTCINQMYSSNEIIWLDNVKSNISYLSAYGKCLFGAESKGIARIILVDDVGDEYLVGEWDKGFITDSTFSDICTETANQKMKKI